MKDVYISKYDAVKTVEKECEAFCPTKLCKLTEYIENAIEEAPVANVQPVIHAHWIELPKAMNPNENPCECSNCGHILSFMNYYPKSKYCPNCGARMDGGSDE